MLECLMLAYLLKRTLHAIPILVGVNLLTFALFFIANSPDDIARAHLGEKYTTQQAIDRWKHSRGYDKPLIINKNAAGIAVVTDTLFFHKSAELFAFQFGNSEQGRNIGRDIHERMWPSLAFAIPTLLIGLLVNISFAMLMVFFRGTYLDAGGTSLCIILMSISTLFFIIFGQFLFGKIMRLVPISGYLGGWSAIKFLALPVAIGVISGIGTGARWYRTLFLEEAQKEYVRTARAKGLSEVRILFKHLLKNALIPIITNIVALIPLLFLGSLLMEAFFGIPGLGSYTIDAIQQQDFDIVRVMVFIGTIAYIIGLLLTDVAYSFVDPRVDVTK